MAYVAVRGGQEAIEASLEMLEWERVKSGTTISVEEVSAVFPDLIDQIMSESSLYAPELAALALKQAQGLPEEAVFLLRAYRSTLERPFASRVVEFDDMVIDRRISAAFKDIPGGQILGATRDYSHRLIDFSLREEDAESLKEIKNELRRKFRDDEIVDSGKSVSMSKVADYLRDEGLIEKRAQDDTPPIDITLDPLVIPAPRSARLQTLTRGMTQAVTALGYAAIRGFGPAHPTVAELRSGRLEIALDDPSADGREGDSYYVGALPVTEVESLFSCEREALNDRSELGFDLGYGMVIGHAETKAIAMSVLDYCLDVGDKRFPTGDEEFVLYHVDAIESTGFISHLKLPHYVTFQSKLSSVRKTKKASGNAEILENEREEQVYEYSDVS